MQNYFFSLLYLAIIFVVSNLSWKPRGKKLFTVYETILYMYDIRYIYIYTFFANLLLINIINII